MDSVMLRRHWPEMVAALALLALAAWAPPPIEHPGQIVLVVVLATVVVAVRAIIGRFIPQG